MANFCGFDMKIAGPEKAVRELVNMLQTKNPYEALGRVFDFHLDEGLTESDPRGTDYISVQGFGDCAWSIKEAMRKGYASLRNLEDEVERLGLAVEAYSSDPGNQFQEHLFIVKGDTLEDECVDYEEHVIDGASEEFIQKLCKEKNLTRDELMAKVNHNDEFTVGGFEDYCDFKNLFDYLEVREKLPLDARISQANEKAAAFSGQPQIKRDLEKE